MQHLQQAPQSDCGNRSPVGRRAAAAAAVPGRMLRRFAGPSCIVAALSLAWACGSWGLAAQRAGRPLAPGTNGQAGQFWTMTTPLDDGRQMLLLLDQQSRCMAIYHVDAAAGTVQLKSTRDLTWDLMIEEFNAQEPRPSSLKKMAEMPK